MRGRSSTPAFLAALVLAACQPAASPSPRSEPAPTATEAAATASPSTGASPSPRHTPTASPTEATPAALWEDVTEAAIGETAEWTNKVEISDVDGDGRPDLLFANGGLYEAAGAPERARVFLNQGAGRFEEGTDAIFGDARFLSRAIKVADLDADADADIVVSGTFGTRTLLFLGDGSGAFQPAPDHTPTTPMSVGDVEPGDVDGDGDLDLMLAEWGEGSPMTNAGGRTRLWRNTGDGRFEDVTAEAMPDVAVRFSWELELVDVDGDWDLDAAISCKQCGGSYLFENDGSGTFTDVTAGRLPQFRNNYEFEAMDVDNDGDLDLATINDGVQPPFSEHLLLNDGRGTFTDGTPERWPAAENPGFDDNMVAFLDVDSDGDADFLVGSLDGEDRLLLNNGQGAFTMQTGILDTQQRSGGTLGIAVGDLDLDGRLDIVEAQGEVPGHESERVYIGTRIAQDTAAPSVVAAEPVASGDGVVVRARIHDRVSPLRPSQFSSVVVKAPVDAAGVAMTWAGEYLWSARLPAGAAGSYTICATDAAGNEACSDDLPLPEP